MLYDPQEQLAKLIASARTPQPTGMQVRPSPTQPAGAAVTETMQDEPSRMRDFATLLTGGFMGGQGLIRSAIGAGLGTLTDSLGKARDRDAAELETLAGMYSKNLARNVTPDQAAVYRDNPDALKAASADTARRRELMTLAGEQQRQQRDAELEEQKKLEARMNGLRMVNDLQGLEWTPEQITGIATEDDLYNAVLKELNVIPDEPEPRDPLADQLTMARIAQAQATTRKVNAETGKILMPDPAPGTEGEESDIYIGRDGKPVIGVDGQPIRIMPKLNERQDRAKVYSTMILSALNMLESTIPGEDRPYYSMLSSKPRQMLSDWGGSWGSALAGEAYGLAEVASQAMAQADLRNLTGAQAPEHEQTETWDRLVPSPGDSPAEVQYKMNYVRNLANSVVQALPPEHQEQVLADIERVRAEGWTNAYQPDDKGVFLRVGEFFNPGESVMGDDAAASAPAPADVPPNVAAAAAASDDPEAFLQYAKSQGWY